MSRDMMFSNGQGSVPMADPTLPTMAMQPPVSSANSPDIVEQLIKTINAPVDLRAATSLVPGQHQAQLPSSLTTPIPNLQQPRYIDTSNIVGKGNARAAGIGNAVIGVTHALSSVVNAEMQHKQSHIRDNATKVITAQSNIDEAQQALNNAKASNDTEGALKYQQTIDENKKVMTQVFSDQKLRKALVKGFDISYTDPSANKTEEHQAVQEALKQAKNMQEKRQLMKDFQAKQNAAAGQAAAEAFAKQQPRGLAPNAQAIAQANMQMAEKKVQQEALKDILVFRASKERTNATLQVGQQRVIEAERLKQATFAHQDQLLNRRIAAAKEGRSEAFKNSWALANHRGEIARETARSIYKDKEADPLKIWKDTRKASEDYSKAYMETMKQYSTLKNQRIGLFEDSKGNKLTPDPRNVKDVDDQIWAVNEQMKLYKQNADSFALQANKMQEGFGFSPGATDGGADSTSADDGAGSVLEDEDDETDLSNPDLY